MNNTWENSGLQAVDRAIVQRRSVLDVLSALEAQQGHPAGRAAFMGALSRCLTIIWHVRARSPRAADFMHPFFSLDHDIARLELSRLLAEGDGAQVSEIARQAVMLCDKLAHEGLIAIARAEPPAPAAAAPIKVEVVGLPDRKITTVIERGGDGSIVGSSQLERDAARV